MALQGPTTRQWFRRATDTLVAGVSSGFRYWGDDDTLVIDRGEGAYVYDMDGRAYIDYQLGFGPVILGHGEPTVAAAVAEAAAAGTTFAMTTAREVEAAEALKRAVSWIDGLRFTNTGTEATMHAIRLARAVTGREVIVKYEGAYHGAHDYVLFSTAGGPPGGLGARIDPIPWQTSSGIPQVIRSLVRTVPFNDLEAVERLFKREGHAIAAFLVEPALGNLFGMMPEPGYLEGLRTLCDDHGVVLVFDEVKTGFRLGLGGAAEYFGVVPDLATYAKSMGNGFPVAAIAGRAEFIGAWAHGGVTQAGTYSGNGVAAAAAAATLAILASGEPYTRIEKAGTALMDGIASICSERGVAAQMIGHPSMFGIFFSEHRPTEFRHLPWHDEDLYERVTHGMIRRGVFPCDDGREPWFVCAAHGDEEVATSLTVFEEALVEAIG